MPHADWRIQTENSQLILSNQTLIKDTKISLNYLVQGSLGKNVLKFNVNMIFIKRIKHHFWVAALSDHIFIEWNPI